MREWWRRTLLACSSSASLPVEPIFNLAPKILILSVSVTIHTHRINTCDLTSQREDIQVLRPIFHSYVSTPRGEGEGREKHTPQSRNESVRFLHNLVYVPKSVDPCSQLEHRYKKYLFKRELCLEPQDGLVAFTIGVTMSHTLAYSGADKAAL
jgi:hypothetical protein